jgi:hypothetical protein
MEGGSRAGRSGGGAGVNVELHIERLVLEGLPVRGDERELVARAVQAKLIDLLGGGADVPRPVSDLMRQGGAVPSLRAGDIPVTRNAHPTRVGQQIAGAVHGAICHE